MCDDSIPSSAITRLPPFLAAVVDQVWHDTSPQPDEVVTNRCGPGVARLQPFHIVRHQKCKWHVIVLTVTCALLKIMRGTLLRGLSVSSAQIAEAVSSFKVWPEEADR